MYQESRKGASIRNQERIDEWTDFSDYERAYMLLPSQFRSGLEVSKRQKDIQERRSQEEERERRLVELTSDSLNRIYNRTGGIMHPDAFLGLMDQDPAVVRRQFSSEIRSLWARRGESEPIPLVYSRIGQERASEDFLEKLKKQLQEAENALANLEAKAKMMGPKKRERFEMDNIYEIRENVGRLRLKVDDPSGTGIRGRLADLKRDRESELADKRGVNAVFPLLSGEQYFEILSRLVGSLIGLYHPRDEARKEKLSVVRTDMEDAILEWALQHGNDHPITGKPKERIRETAPIGLSALKPAIRRLLEEFQKMRDVLKHNPSGPNLQHARLLFENVQRIISRE